VAGSGQGSARAERLAAALGSLPLGDLENLLALLRAEGTGGQGRQVCGLDSWRLRGLGEAATAFGRLAECCPRGCYWMSVRDDKPRAHAGREPFMFADRSDV